MNENNTKTDDYQIPDDLRVVQITVANVMRLEAAAISPTDEVTKIGGFNANGKSSLLNSVEFTLCGGRALPPEPLRRGAKKGFSRIRIESRDSDFGLVAERRYTKKSDQLVVMLDGQDEPAKAPQELLNRLYSISAAQPDDFLELKPKDQLAALQKIVGVSFDDLDAETATLYETRKGITSQIKLMEGQVSAMPSHPEAKESVDTGALLAELRQVEADNATKDAAEREQQTLLARIAQYDEELAAMRTRALELKATQASCRERAEKLEVGIKVDTQPITDRLINAQELNEKVEANERKREAEKSLRAKNLESEKLTLAIEKIAEQREFRLSTAKFPVPGLGFSDDGVTLHGLPFKQASQMQQIITTAAIELHKHPLLRLVLMRRGSLLDPQHQAALREWAKEKNCQILLEVVGKDADCEVIIEDGLVEKGESNGK